MATRRTRNGLAGLPPQTMFGVLKSVDFAEHSGLPVHAACESALKPIALGYRWSAG